MVAVDLVHVPRPGATNSATTASATSTPSKQNLQVEQTLYQHIRNFNTTLYQVSRPALLPYRSGLPRLANTLLRLVPILLEFTHEQQSLRFSMLRGFQDKPWNRGGDAQQSVDGITHAYVHLSSGIDQPMHMVQLYSMNIRIDAHFSGLQYWMYYWSLPTAVMFIGILAMGIFFGALVLWWMLYYTFQPIAAVPVTPSSVSMDRPGRHPESSRSSSGEGTDTPPPTLLTTEESDELSESYRLPRPRRSKSSTAVIPRLHRRIRSLSVVRRLPSPPSDDSDTPEVDFTRRQWVNRGSPRSLKSMGASGMEEEISSASESSSTETIRARQPPWDHPPRKHDSRRDATSTSTSTSASEQMRRQHSSHDKVEEEEQEDKDDYDEEAEEVLEWTTHETTTTTREELENVENQVPEPPEEPAVVIEVQEESATDPVVTSTATREPSLTRRRTHASQQETP